MRYVSIAYPYGDLEFAPRIAVQTITSELLERITKLQQMVIDHNLTQIQTSAADTVKWIVDNDHTAEIEFSNITMHVTEKCVYFSAINDYDESRVITAETPITTLSEAYQTGAELLFDDNFTRDNYSDLLVE